MKMIIIIKTSVGITIGIIIMVSTITMSSVNIADVIIICIISTGSAAGPRVRLLCLSLVSLCVVVCCYCGVVVAWLLFVYTMQFSRCVCVLYMCCVLCLVVCCVVVRGRRDFCERFCLT